MSSYESKWPRWALLLALLAGNIALALGPWSVRLADTGPVSAGFWRLALAFPFLVLLACANGEQPFAISPSVRNKVLIAGLAFALDLANWHVGIEMTRLGNATLFGNAGSLVLMVWGFLVMRRLPASREWLAIGMALLGAGILMDSSLAISRSTLWGDVFCLIAGLLYGAYLLLLQDARAKIGSWSLLVWTAIAGMPVLLLIALFLGEPVWPTNWGPLIALAVLSQLIGQGLLVFSLKHFTPLVIGLVLLTQPAVAALSGWLAFGETIGPVEIAGMLLLGLALAMSRGRALPRRKIGPESR